MRDLGGIPKSYTGRYAKAETAEVTLFQRHLRQRLPLQRNDAAEGKRKQRGILTARVVAVIGVAVIKSGSAERITWLREMPERRMCSLVYIMKTVTLFFLTKLVFHHLWPMPVAVAIWLWPHFYREPA